MSPRIEATRRSLSRAVSSASIASLLSMPTTQRPALVIGTASRPVPTPSSSTRPFGPAIWTIRATVAATSVTSAYHSSYTSANPSPYERWSYPRTAPRLRPIASRV